MQARIDAAGGMPDDELAKTVLGTQLALKDLGYLARPFDGQLDERTAAALVAYRRDTGLGEADHLLDRELAERMDSDISSMHLPPMLGRDSYYDRSGMIVAKGTWKLHAGRLANRSQLTELTCLLPEGVCIESTAKLSDSGGNLFLHVDLHAIDTVTDETLTTRPDKAECAQSTLMVNRKLGKVSRTRVTTSTTGTCSNLERENLHLDLVNGRQLSDPMTDAAYEARRRILNLPPNLVD
jgi:hypothetical protein